MENTGFGKPAVRRLFDSKGCMTVNPETRINELKDFYYKLYCNQDSDGKEELFFDSIDDSNIPRPGENSRTEH